jgi:hypothetical protein
MDFSGFGNNKTFKAGGDPLQPYYFVSASLNLAGAVDGGTYYFNLDNNLEYAFDRDYSRFVIVDETSLISEVIAFAEDDLVPVNPEADVQLMIGGADRLNTDEPWVIVPWAAPPQSAPVPPPGFVGDVVSIDDVNAGVVNYYGHEGGHFPYFTNLASNPDLSQRYKYLAVTVNPAANEARKAAVAAAKAQADPNARKKRSLGMPRGLPQGTAVIAQGSLKVLLKIYPKERP